MSKKNYIYELWETYCYGTQSAVLVGTYASKEEAEKARWHRSLKMNDTLVIGDTDDYVYEIKRVNKYKCQ